MTGTSSSTANMSPDLSGKTRLYFLLPFLPLLATIVYLKVLSMCISRVYLDCVFRRGSRSDREGGRSLYWPPPLPPPPRDPGISMDKTLLPLEIMSGANAAADWQMS